MKTIVLSPSKIEQFRKHYQGEFNESITKENVIDSLLNIKKEKFELDFGNAYHLLIEKGPRMFWDKKTSCFVVSDKVKLTKEEASLGIELRRKYQNSLFECPFTCDLVVNNYKIIIPMRVDFIHGNEVHEVKTTSSNLDLESYYRSYQWRYYLLRLELNYIDYHVFKFTDLSNKQKEVSLVDFKIYREENMVENARNMAALTLEFALDNGLGNKLIYES